MPEFLTDQDVFLFAEGTHDRMYEHLGAHVVEAGAHFAVWAPNAQRVSVIGDFNGWRPDAHQLYPSESGIWRGHVSEAK
ncbi:MAG: 1,4-alpha-glucan branching enzyme, partial [Acidimicrobiia bacterium]|nr:1,4-alpha-glucan branching enzyme [Acidimicrobiia bacterium]